MAIITAFGMSCKGIIISPAWCWMKKIPKPIGMWVRKYHRYIKEYRPVLYTNLLVSGKLTSHLVEIDNRAEEIVNAEVIFHD